MISAEIKKIRVYPVKSLDGQDIQTSEFNANGGLKYDRQFALHAEAGIIMNTKKFPDFLKIRSDYDFDNMNLFLADTSSRIRFNLFEDKKLIEEWFSEFFHFKVFLKSNDQMGFPDDIERPGPTICSSESIKAVMNWFPNLNEEEVRRRFRTNIELASSEQNPFWEDMLFGDYLKPKKFYLGKVLFNGVKPCPRCPVPSRDSNDASILKGFQKRFSENRKQHLLGTVDPKQFPHFYMFAVNTEVLRSHRIELGERLSF